MELMAYKIPTITHFTILHTEFGRSIEMLEAFKETRAMGVNRVWPELRLIDIEFWITARIDNKQWSLQTCYEVLGSRKDILIHQLSYEDWIRRFLARAPFEYDSFPRS
jgi:hypothetical protein